MAVAVGSSKRPPSRKPPLVSILVHGTPVCLKADEPVVCAYQMLPLRQTELERMNESPASSLRRVAGHVPLQLCGNISPSTSVNGPPGRVCPTESRVKT